MIKRVIKVFSVFLIALGFSLSPFLTAAASSDTTRPTVTSLSLDKTTVQPGDEIHVSVEASDAESGISDGAVSISKVNGDQGQMVELSYNPETNKYEGTFNITNNTIIGDWYISMIVFYDKAGNQFVDFPEEGDQLYKIFLQSVMNSSTDTTPPSVTNISFDKTTLSPGDEVHISVEASDAESGISDGAVSISKVNGDQGQMVELSYNPETNKYEGTFNVTNNTIIGDWYISMIVFYDKAGNQFVDFPEEGDQLYKIFTVMNSSTDTTPPSVTNISFDKTTLSPGDEVHISVEASDAESGISDGSVSVSKVNGDQGQMVELSYNPETNKYEGTFNVTDNTIIGDWYISMIVFQDKASNQFVDFPQEGDNLYRTFTVMDSADQPSVPKVSPVNDSDNYVSGTADPNSTINITNGEDTWTDQTNTNGSFRVAIAKQQAGTTLTVTSKNAFGNTSDKVNVTVTDATPPSAPTVDTVSDQTTLDRDGRTWLNGLCDKWRGYMERPNGC
ncbi:Ig-like domain-containing protein [Terrilactibacillus sp. S3-3]|nr:Ig-like domain-containing protein [Terrilactibacillus sp. S3-3]